MNPLLKEKQQAISLRRKGWSYSEIQEKLDVSQASLSLWLRGIPLSERQIKRLKEKQRASQKIAIEYVKNYRIKKTREIKQYARDEIGILSSREQWLIAVALYWAEGTKEKEHGHLVCFSNSSPAMIIFFRNWARDFLGMKDSGFIYELYIHEKTRSLEEAIDFWSSLLGIERSELKIRFKRHNISPRRKNIDYNYKGLIRVIFRRSVDLNRKIDGWINGIASNPLIGE